MKNIPESATAIFVFCAAAALVLAIWRCGAPPTIPEPTTMEECRGWAKARFFHCDRMPDCNATERYRGDLRVCDEMFPDARF
jgi:hypothetical protein